jgi:hypothetical protein
MTFRLVVATRHENPDRADYWLTRTDATLDTAVDWDGTTLMLDTMIRYVGPMLAGDMTRVSVFLNGALIGSYRGKPHRTDEGLARLAGHACHSYREFASFRPMAAI